MDSPRRKSLLHSRKNQRSRRLRFESLEDRRMLAVDWRNPVNSLDVSGDGFISPLDALQPINELNDNGSHALADQRPGDKPYWDASGDQFISPLDALQVINALNSNQTVPYVLGEGQQIATEQSVTITVGQTTGTRTYRLQVTPNFDTTDDASSSDDLFAIYLVDPQQPATTLLDRGTPGTTLFTLSESSAEFAPGRVRWDGEIVEIDLSELTGRDTAELRLQLLNTDGDRGSRVAVRPLTNEVDPSGVIGPMLLDSTTPVAAGAAVNLTSLTAATDVNVQVENVRFSSVTQRYVAELRLQNIGESLGRSVAVAFPDLPSGVTLRNPSGTTADGDPYINFAPAISRGGLSANSRSEPLLVEFDDPTRVPFALAPQILAGANQPPTLAAIGPLTVMPGGNLATRPTATDPDGDAITFSLGATGSASASALNLPTGILRGNGLLEFTPEPDQLGQYTFDIVASDGALEARQTVTLNVVADPNTTTRVSGFILDLDQSPLAGMQVEIGAVQGLTQSDGSFTLDLGSGPVVGDTLKVRGELFPGPLVYPFIAEKLAFILEHEVFEGLNNVIDRPIFLPPLDVAGGTMIDPMQNTTVQQEVAPGELAEVFVAAGTLMNQQSTPFTGVLSITEVPTDLTPAALPNNLSPGLVVTIQPGEMVFASPAPLTLPNRSGFAPGTSMDLWSINPVTGEFVDVGDGTVSADGSLIQTTSGGIRNSSWHFFSPILTKAINSLLNPWNHDFSRHECPKQTCWNSEVELHTGAVIEGHALAPYQSLGVSRGLMLNHDSLRADPRPIEYFGFEDVLYDPALRLVAKMTVHHGSFASQVPGFAGGQFGLTGGEHIWSIPQFPPNPAFQNRPVGKLDAALQLDLRSLPSGVYEVEIEQGLRRFDGQQFTGTDSMGTDRIVHVSTINSPFGSGWGLVGLQEIIVNDDGSALLIDGDGSELLFEAPPAAGEPFNSPPGDFSVLEHQANGTFQRTLTDQTVFEFNAQNQLAAMRDRNGNETRYAYDAAGILATMTDPVGLVTTFNSTAGRITAIIDPAGRATRLAYDSIGNLARITDPDDSFRAFGYDPDRHIASETDKRGNLEQSFYGFHGRAVRALAKDGSVLQVEPVQIQGLLPPDATVNPMAPPVAFSLGSAAKAMSADGNGSVETNMLDRLGQTIAASDAVGRLPQVERNAENLITRLTDARENVSAYEYDTLGNLLRDTITLPAPNSFFGSALRFDGVDDTVRIPDSPSLDLRQEATLSTWVRFDKLPSQAGHIMHLMGKSQSGNDLDLHAEGDDKFHFYVGPGAPNTLASTTVIEKGRWYQVTVTYKANDKIELYLDGRLEGSRAIPGVTRQLNSNPLTLGTNSVFSGRFLAGTLDEVRVWDVVRTADQITAEMQTTLLGNEPNLVAYYRFDEGSGDTAQDLTANHNDGTLGGGVAAQRPSFVTSTILGTTLATRVFSYDPTFNQLASLTDELGHPTLLDIDPANGNVRSIMQVIDEVGGPDDLVTLFTYAAHGLVDTQTDPLDRVTDYDYDTLGRLIAVTMAQGTPDEGVWRFEYDAAGNITVAFDENGNRTDYIYDPLNRLTRVTEPDPDASGPLTRPVTAFTYDAAGNLTIVTDARGNTMRYEYDTLDRRTKSIDPQMSEASYQYDLAGNLTSVTDPLGQETRYLYDARNRLVEAIAADSGRTKFGYDADDNTTAVTDPVGNLTTFRYDARNRLLRESTGGDSVASYEFDGSLDSSTGPSLDSIGPGQFQEDTVFGVQRPVYAFDKGSGFTLDTQGLITKDNYSIELVMQFDEATSYAKIVDYEDRTLDSGFYARDGKLNFYPIVDGGVFQPDVYQHVVLTRSSDTQLVVGYINGVQAFSFADTQLRADIQNANDLLTFFVDDSATGGRETSAGRIALLRVYDKVLSADEVAERAQDPQSEGEEGSRSLRTYEYDAADNLIARTDRNGRRTEFAYDDVHRPTSETWIGGGNAIEYSYDKASNLRSATDSFSGLAMTYDTRDRVRTVDNAGTPNVLPVVLTYNYDPASRLTSVADTINGGAAGVNAYTYDNLDRVTRITQSGSGVSNKRVDLGYNAIGQFTAIDRFADLAGTQLVTGTSYGFDNLNRLTSQTHRNTAATTVAFENLVYDADSRITQIVDSDGTTDYAYDNRDQLTGADHSGANPDETYAYDANGNRISSSVHGSGYQTGTGNRLLSDGTFDYAYDANGNLIRRTTISDNTSREFQYDFRNRLVVVLDKDALGTVTQRADYTYDAFNRRIAKAVDSNAQDSVPAAVTYFVYDGADVLLEFLDADGNAGPSAPVQTFRYLHGPAVDQVFAQEGAGDNVQWLLADHLGTVRDLVDNSGAVVNHRTYDSFGNLVSETNPAASSRYGFTGRELDAETGLYYYRARYYDAQTGRFTREDPMGFLGGDPNLYRYVVNNPSNFRDPNGLHPNKWEPNHGDLEEAIRKARLLPTKQEVLDALRRILEQGGLRQAEAENWGDEQDDGHGDRIDNEGPILDWLEKEIEELERSLQKEREKKEKEERERRFHPLPCPKPDDLAKGTVVILVGGTLWYLTHIAPFTPWPDPY